MNVGENLKLCCKCGRIHPASEHMRPGSTTVFKWCTACRARGRARSQLRRERKKAVLASFEAQMQANPQFTQSIYNDIAARNRSAFSFREQLPLLATPPATLTGPRSETPRSTGFERSEINVSQRDRGGSFESMDCSDSSQSDSDEDTESNISTSTPAYFICTHCSIPRKAGLGYSGICVYCLEPEQKYCISGDHEADRSEFYDSEGKEQAACRNCREGIPFDEEMEIAQGSDDEEDDSY